MTLRERDSSFKKNHNDSLPHSSGTPQRTEASIVENELSEVADMIKWPRMPEMEEFEAMAERLIIAGFYEWGELMDTSAAERTQHYDVAAKGYPGRERLMRDMLDYTAPPALAG